MRGVERGVREIPLLLALKGGAAGHGIPDVGTALNAAEVRAGEHCGFTSRGRMCTFVTLWQWERRPQAGVAGRATLQVRDPEGAPLRAGRDDARQVRETSEAWTPRACPP